MNPSARANIILTAARNIQAGDSTYGDPRVNLACAGELKRIFLRYAIRSGRRIGPAEHEAVDMLLTKVARIACGPVVHDDNYADAAAYAALAGECASQNAAGTAASDEDETDPFDISEQELLGELDDRSNISKDEGHRPAISKDNADR